MRFGRIVIAFQLAYDSSAWLIVRNRSPCCAIEIVVLAVLEAPKKRSKAKRAKRNCKRNEINQNLHQTVSLFCRRARNALIITNSEEPDIATAAISGVTSPAMAMGTASKL